MLATTQPKPPLLRLDEDVTPSIGPPAPLSPAPPAVVLAPAVVDVDEVLLAGAGVNVVDFDCEVVLDKVDRTVVGAAEELLIEVEVEDGGFEELVLEVEAELEAVEELLLELVVLDGRVTIVGAEAD